MNSADLEQIRRDFAQRVQQKLGLPSTGLVDGLAAVPRENFVGRGPWSLLRSSDMQSGYQVTPDDDPRQLYDSVLVALDASRGLNNGEPVSLLHFLNLLQLKPGDRFLHIGCGVGYYTAIASYAVLPAGSVVGVEVDAELAERARANLSPYQNVHVVSADGTEFKDGSFDAIFVNAGATEVRSVWLDQLNEGGRLLVPLTVAFSSLGGGALDPSRSALFGQAGKGYTLLVVKQGDRFDARFVSMVAIFHCIGARSPETEALLEIAFRSGPPAFRSLRRDVHEKSPECWLHAPTFCLSKSG